jgi:hypothetical protein
MLPSRPFLMCVACQLFLVGIWTNRAPPLLVEGVLKLGLLRSEQLRKSVPILFAIPVRPVLDLTVTHMKTEAQWMKSTPMVRRPGGESAMLVRLPVALQPGSACCP